MASCHPAAVVALRIWLATRQPVGQTFQRAPEVLLSGSELRNPSIFIAHKPGVALVWKSQAVAFSVFFALQQPSGQIGRECGNLTGLVSLTVFRPREAGREAARRAGMFLGKLLLELKFFSGTCHFQHFLPESCYTQTFLTVCIKSLNSFQPEEEKI